MLTMASLGDVFSEQEMTNWLKTWLALNITKTGLHDFVDREVQNFQTSILQSVTSNLGLSPNTTCTRCCTANLLKCPTNKLCNKSKHNPVCKFHDTASKQPRQCPTKICDEVRDEITKAHRYKGPSYNNTSAEQWASNHWEVGKCYMPPDGYISVSSFEETDFNGVISIILNCTIFDRLLSFSIAPKNPSPPCLLTKARDVGKAVRHSSDCKVTSTDLQEYVLICVTLLSDSKVLRQDGRAQDAVRKLNQLQTDNLNLSVAEMSQLLKDAQQTLTEAKYVSEMSKTKMENFIDQYELKLNEHVQNIRDKCTVDITEHTNACTENSKRELVRHVQSSIDLIQKVNSRKVEDDYEYAVEELRRRLIKYYIDNTQYVSVASLLMQNHDISLMKIYATPAIHRVETNKDGKRKKSDPVFTYKDWCNECISARGPPEKDTDFCDTETLKREKKRTTEE